MSEFHTRVSGIPCICRVDYHTPEVPATWHEPAYGGDFDFTILDRRGRHAPWLEEKIKADDVPRLWTEYEEFLRAERDAAAEP